MMNRRMNMLQRQCIRLHIDTNDRSALSPYIFGHNLEHTRASVSGGLSAQMLRNRKFAGRPGARTGVAAEWFGIGERTYFCTDRDPYVRHFKENGMWRRNETNAQTVQNPVQGQLAGIAQGNLFLQKDHMYEMAVVAKCSRDTALLVALTDRGNEKVYAEHAFDLMAGEWQRCECKLTSCADDPEGCIRLTFMDQGSVFFGAVSLLPEGHFHGLRRDVVDRMKELGVSLLRWPGGNFAGEYRWQDMFLPVDMRAPLQAYTEDETQPYTHGYDMHEIDTDTFIALCREIGAEPYITLNPAWDTVEECAAWVEYCNGSADTPYGGLRASRGHREPYRVKKWSLGNEFGYGHMEGPMSPEEYVKHCKPVAQAMLRVSPDLEICSAGPYSYEDRMLEWIGNSAKAFAPEADYVSFHTYQNLTYDFTSQESIKRIYGEAWEAAQKNREHLKLLRKHLPDSIRISYDEWNLWAAWFRRTCTVEGMFTARMIHMLLENCDRLLAPVVCYFQPVGEGAVDVYPDRAVLSANGQVFSLLCAHRDSQRCRVDGAGEEEAFASLKENVMSVSLINPDFDRERTYCIDHCGQVLSAKALAASDLLPGSRFDEMDLQPEATEETLCVTLPPRSIGLVRIALL